MTAISVTHQAIQNKKGTKVYKGMCNKVMRTGATSIEQMEEVKSLISVDQYRGNVKATPIC
ncbi:hypothetical protein ACTXT7_000607 [Hymenolepis weldensis]